MKNNGLIMQYFEHNLPPDQTLWTNAAKDVNKLKNLGISAVWLPPAYKGIAGAKDVGYNVYDTYDLGEFNQKGSIPTKYGTKKEYIEAIKILQENGIDVYADIVLGRRIGADKTEIIHADEFNKQSRNQMVGDEKIICGWTKFTFPGRKNKYSKFKWNWKHFSGIDWDGNHTKNLMSELAGDAWKKIINQKNYDYLMRMDIDFENQAVIDEMYKWGAWYLKMTGVNGVRLDSVKQVGYYFYRDWLSGMSEVIGRELFAVGDYQHWDVRKLLKYLEDTDYCISLFDFPLHYKFYDASKAHGEFDMANLLTDTLMMKNPLKAVTFVDNHDTQPGQLKQSFIEDWFKPHAYTTILLREEGYPCVFYGDYHGIANDKVPSKKTLLDRLVKLRKKYAYGTQHDYFDDYNVVGWTREGDNEHKNSGLAVVMSDSTGGTKRMYVGKQFAGEFFVDALGNAKYNIKIDTDGCGDFYVNRETVSVWIEKECAKAHSRAEHSHQR